MRRGFYAWRYYMLVREDYIRCMEKAFSSNLLGMWCAGIWLVVFLFINLIISVISADINALFLMDIYMPTSYVYLGLTVLATLFLMFVWRLRNLAKKGKHVSKTLIYVLVISLYAIFIFTGMFISVWTSYDSIGVIFMILLVCSICLVIDSPIANLSLVLIAVAVFVTLSVLIKEHQYWHYDILNVSVAASAAIMFNWFINVYKMSAVLNGINLEEERDKYQGQSSIDELTQLSNRRDFERRFKRYLTDYREDDNFLCFAVIDIDFFKNYNDHYGHPKGDDCLRAIGRKLAIKWDNPSVYAARIGGEEFALLWFEKDKENVNGVVMQLQQRIDELSIPHAKSSVAEYITASVGVYVVSSGAPYNYSEDSIYGFADSALYKAKKAGRNRAVVIDENGKYLL